jgi:hypothetical protein
MQPAAAPVYIVSGNDHQYKATARVAVRIRFRLQVPSPAATMTAGLLGVRGRTLELE